MNKKVSILRSVFVPVAAIFLMSCSSNPANDADLAVDQYVPETVSDSSTELAEVANTDLAPMYDLSDESMPPEPETGVVASTEPVNDQLAEPISEPVAEVVSEETSKPAPKPHHAKIRTPKIHVARTEVIAQPAQVEEPAAVAIAPEPVQAQPVAVAAASTPEALITTSSNAMATATQNEVGQPTDVPASNNYKIYAAAGLFVILLSYLFYRRSKTA